MRWTSWLPRSRSPRLRVVGLDIGPEHCCLVVLSGSFSQPDRVCRAERLALPDGFVVHGEVLQPLALGHWLKSHLQVGDAQPTLAYLGLDSACVSQHSVSLAAGLSPEDVAFQLQAEVQSLWSDWPGGGHEVCMDYVLDAQPEDAEPGPASEQRYRVQVAPRLRVEALQRVAQIAGLKAMGVEPREDAAQRAQQSHTLPMWPEARAALTLSCDEALGLALRAWHDVGTNFLPHREHAQQVLRRAWLLRATVCAMGGACLAAGFAMAMSSAAKTQASLMADVAAVTRAYEDAQKAHANAKAEDARHAEQARWIKARQDVQAQSLQWSRVLSHAAQGVWVSSVKQQGTRWTVQGEALSSDHAQQLTQQLDALGIWAQAPELVQVQVMSSVSSTGLPVWHFRIEANLKAGV